MEALYAIEVEKDQKPPSFSVQHLLDCDDTNWGCDGGWMTDAYEWTIDNGVVAWDDYKDVYKGKVGKCESTKHKSKFHNT